MKNYKYYNSDTGISGSVSPAAHTATTDTSSFPSNLDNLKTIQFNGTTINNQLKAYYDLLIKHLGGATLTTVEVQQFNSLTESLSSVQLTSADYMNLRDGLIEVTNYIKEFADTQIYGTGGFTERTNAAVSNFILSLNAKINEVNNLYNNATGFVPNGSITLSVLSPELRTTIEALTSGVAIYVDTTVGGAVTVPSAFSIKPVVIKMKE